MTRASANIFCGTAWRKLSADAACRRVAGTALLAMSLSFAGCGQEPSEPAQAPVELDRAMTDPDEIAVRVVAEFLSIPPSEITLVSVEAKDFGDPSLGCPEPGMAYPQVITPGHRVLVEAEGRRFDVRVSGSHGRICRKPGRSGPANSSDGDRPENSSPVTSQIDHARASLAARLDLDIDDVRVTDVRRFTPEAAAPGCRPDCGADARDCGYLIGLFFDGRRYEYHSHAGRIEPCPALSAI